MSVDVDSITISVITPIYNGGRWIDQCFASILAQDVPDHIRIEVCVYDDCSQDDTAKKLEEWTHEFSKSSGFSLKNSQGVGNTPQGVGYSKNRAVEMSSGEYLCFQDVDDHMHPKRIFGQLTVALKNQRAIVGCQFVRDPLDSTIRFTRWSNNLPSHLLTIQVLTSHGPTVIMPTWFCSRAVFDRVGGFSEKGYGTPEDLIFFYRHLDLDGSVLRVDRPLLTYRYHANCVTNSISEETIWKIRLERLEETILSHWDSFIIWNAGKQGRKLWRSLTADSKKKVQGFCDVDTKKIGNMYEPYLGSRSEKIKIPIFHFKNCSPPFVICVKMDLTKGQFEMNLNSLCLTEGVDYVMFS